MSFSIQTNVSSLMAQENMRMNSNFQNQTIQRLTSGYRINQSGDDAAGLGVANQYRSATTELTQGVRNANDGLSTLQIIDGGLNNISKILDRMKTLATQSSSDTFTGNRGTLDAEYQTLIGEINRQASNVGLSTGTQGGRFNSNIGVYIGGGATQANSIVNIDLSGSTNRVDSSALGLASTTVLSGGSNTVGGTTSVDLRSGTYLAGGTQSFTFNLGNSSFTASIGNGTGGAAITGQQAVDALNTQIHSLGISAAIDSTTGKLAFSGGSTAFTVTVAASTAGTAIADNAGATAGASNNTLYDTHGAASFTAVSANANAETLSFTPAGKSAISVTLDATSGASLGTALTSLNTALSGSGITAVTNQAGTGIDFQSASSFSLTAQQASSTAQGVFGVGSTLTNENPTVPTAGATASGNAQVALTAINSAVTSLGNVQGKVGAGQNQLQYAIQLAQSQISNYSSAESRIRDADVAQEAANLTKAQVLQQASMAALAQANSAPQSLLSLLRG